MMTRFQTLAVALTAAIGVAAATQASAPAASPAQTQDPQTELQVLEEEHIRTRAEQGQSHASGGRPDLGPVVLGNPTSAVKILRVGLHFTTGAEFGTLHHPYVEIANTDGEVRVIDRANGKEVTVLVPGSRIRVEHDGTHYLIAQDGAHLGAYAGPVFFRPTSRANLFQIHSIRRTFLGSKVPLYRGSIEVARGRITAGLSVPRVNLVNIVEVEDYVPGVVANESIASFHSEALKAQAVAARGYAVANIGNYVARGYPFDIVDSSASQVYRGVISEHVNAVRASRETLGLVASYSGRIIGALYSSSFGGHSEDNEWIFTASPPSTNVIPYLRGIYDGDGVPPDFSTDAGVDAFWRAPVRPDLYDDCSRVTPRNSFSRWKLVLPEAAIRARLSPAMRLTPESTNTGAITNIEVVSRTAAAGRIAIARITLTSGTYLVRGWDQTRFVLGRSALPFQRACGGTFVGANFTLNSPSSLELVWNADATVKEVVAYGGGWGHNLGMSQFGSNGRGHAGQDFIEILKAYYTGVEIGSFPIDIGRAPGSGPPTLRQAFVAPNGQGTLEIRSSGLKGLRVHINELHDLTFDEATLASGVVRVDVSSYLVTGTNVIQYNPVGLDGEATVSVTVR